MRRASGHVVLVVTAIALVAKAMLALSLEFVPTLRLVLSPAIARIVGLMNDLA